MNTEIRNQILDYTRSHVFPDHPFYVMHDIMDNRFNNETYLIEDLEEN